MEFFFFILRDANVLNLIIRETYRSENKTPTTVLHTDSVNQYVLRYLEELKKRSRTLDVKFEAEFWPSLSSGIQQNVLQLVSGKYYRIS
jgi:hypothetical protein